MSDPVAHPAPEPELNTERRGTPPSPHAKRHFQACLRCRKRKARCPGGQPCGRCLKTGHDCVYDEQRKVLVSEKYLRGLENGVGQVPSTRSEGEIVQPLEPSTLHSHHLRAEEDEISTSLAKDTTASTTDSVGGYHYVGSSSTWGFAWRLRGLLASSKGPSPQTLSEHDKEVDDLFHVRLHSFQPAQAQDAALLPKETASRYLSNYSYHIAPIWYFAETQSMAHERLFWQRSPVEFVRALEHAQYNLIMALGKMLEQGRSYEDLPGESYVLFAVSLMEKVNDTLALVQAPMLAAQNYCLIAFYYHAVNMRNKAYINIGLASRVAITQGLHRVSQTAMDPANTSDQENRIRFWWSLYFLDITMSSLMGAPVPVHIREVTTRQPLPQPGLPSPEPLKYLVRLAHLNAEILADVYCGAVDKTLAARTIIRVVKEVDSVVKSIHTEQQHDPHSDQHYSRTTATLCLFASQVQMLAIRPIIFYLVEQQVKILTESSSGPSQPSRSRTVQRLLRKALDTAVSAVKVLSSLRYQGQLQGTISFDVTAAFSSAVTVAAAGFVSGLADTGSMDTVQSIVSLLNELAKQGNAIAQKRHTELQDLIRLIMNTKVKNTPILTLPPVSNSSESTMLVPSMPQPQPTPMLESFYFTRSSHDLDPNHVWDQSPLSTFMLNEENAEDFDFIFSQWNDDTRFVPFTD